MKRVGRFEKVSQKEYTNALRSLFGEAYPEQYAVEILEDIEMPRRATSGSAGYDIFAPADMVLNPGETVTVPTGLRCRIENGWFLGVFPRSGLGFKYRLQLDNTVGIIDSDYYISDNEGHIFIKITNDSRTDKRLEIHAGDAFAQAIFIPFGVTYDDGATGTRNGGMGSTDR